MRNMSGLILLLLAVACSAGFAQPDALTTSDSTTIADSLPPPEPVSSLVAVDTDDDHGHSITLRWGLSPDDGAGQNTVIVYEAFRWLPFSMDDLDSLCSQLSQVDAEISDADGFTSEMVARRKSLRDRLEELVQQLPVYHSQYPDNGEWRYIGKVAAGTMEYVDAGSKEPRVAGYMPDFADYYYRVDAVTIDSSVRTASVIVGPVQSYGQWFNKGRYAVFFAVIIFAALTIVFVRRARKGADLYVRPLGGIEAVDDAIGRATEMGRPILYVLGLGTAEMIATIASFTILGRVAKRVAEYQTELIVPCYDAIVMAVAQEVVKTSYMDAGRPDDYKEDSVFFVTNMQFAYVAGVNGIMLRERPVTNVYMGKFFAESLILAETGSLAGSIQIAGTDELAQLPFFIVACDYTLIGEELYAASAYLGREPVLLGSLKAQDYAKALFLIIAVAGLVAANLEWTAFTDLFQVVD